VLDNRRGRKQTGRKKESRVKRVMDAEIDITFTPVVVGKGGVMLL
jgi:hypothetical protein